MLPITPMGTCIPVEILEDPKRIVYDEFNQSFDVSLDLMVRFL